MRCSHIFASPPFFFVHVYIRGRPVAGAAFICMEETGGHPSTIHLLARKPNLSNLWPMQRHRCFRRQTDYFSLCCIIDSTSQGPVSSQEQAMSQVRNQNSSLIFQHLENYLPRKMRQGCCGAYVPGYICVHVTCALVTGHKILYVLLLVKTISLRIMS